MKIPIRIQNLIILLSLIVVFGVTESCAPVFSELQSARTVGKSRIELTPSYSTVSASEDGESGGLQNQMGLRAAYGLTNRLDLRAQYEVIWLKDSDFDDGTSVIGIGPKYSLKENNVAFYLPIGRALGDGTSDSWQIHPTFLLTVPAVENKLDITLSPKYLITFCDDCGSYFATNLGVAFGSDLTKWAIRAEYGLMYDFSEPGHFSQFSVGFSYVFGNTIE